LSSVELNAPPPFKNGKRECLMQADQGK